MEEFIFAESLFAAEKPRRKAGPDSPGYSAKLCESQWFAPRSADARCRDHSELLSLHKFRADAAYRARDYAAALGWYDACLSLVPLSNTAVRRDALEARSRCLARVGRTEEALKTAHSLGTIATNADHDCVVYALVAAIQRQAGHLRRELEALTRLTTLRPLDAWHWRRLAAIYRQLAQGAARGSVRRSGERSHGGSDGQSGGGDAHGLCDDNDRSAAGGRQRCAHSDSHGGGTCARPQVGHESATRMIANDRRAISARTNAASAASGGAASTELTTSGSPVETDEPERWRVYAWACLVRARLLLQLTSASQSSFMLERNLEVQTDITSDLEKSDLDDTTLARMAEVLGEDLVTLGTTGDGTEETNETRRSDDTPNFIDTFEKRWFGRLHAIVRDDPEATTRTSAD